MTENDIIKALEYHSNEYTFCMECPLGQRGECSCELSKHALDLINRKNAEIERLREALAKSNKCLEEGIELAKQTPAMVTKAVNEARAAAIKDTIEAIKKKSNSCVMEHNGITIESTRSFQISAVKLYEIEKEMTGGKT